MTMPGAKEGPQTRGLSLCCLCPMLGRSRRPGQPPVPEGGDTGPCDSLESRMSLDIVGSCVLKEVIDRLEPIVELGHCCEPVPSPLGL